MICQPTVWRGWSEVRTKSKNTGATGSPAVTLARRGFLRCAQSSPGHPTIGGGLVEFSLQKHGETGEAADRQKSLAPGQLLHRFPHRLADEVIGLGICVPVITLPAR